MGITGLIPFLEKASSKIHLKDLRGSTVVVDTYCWLHKGVFSCAEKLARGEDSDQYLEYCLKYVQMLLSYDIKPILVFDGGHLPAKALTEKRRREARQQSKKRAAELLRLGRIEEARSHMRRSVDVTHEMALRLICECRRRNVDCIVAPYEADAQMAWFNKVDLAQYVVTEDSDLTLFGARNVIFKLDLSGAGLLVESNKLHLAMGCRSEKYTFDKFLRMCILSGCDYLDSLPGIGLAKACKFILKTEEDDMWKALKKIPQYLNMKNLEVDDEYIENFHIAEATFKHMYIYNPLRRKMERLHELQEFETDLRYCCNAGTITEGDEKAFQLALGNINPFSLKQLDNWHPDSETAKTNSKRAKHKSIWQQNFEAHKVKKTDDKKLFSCALYFKKVDFISGTIDQDINVSIQEENKKPEEADIFSMYRNELEEYKPKQRKRKRQNSSSSCSSNDFESSAVVTRIRHNPFAKVATAAEDEVGAAVICENSSLLKVLSPKKKLGSYEKNATRLNELKHALFIENDAPESEPLPTVEIRSRLFASNVKKVCKINEKQSKELANTIDEIESLSQQTKHKQLNLYHQSPPEKKNNFCIKSQEENISSYADSGIESISTDILNDELDVDIKLKELSPSLIELNCIQRLEVDEAATIKELSSDCQGELECITISDIEDNSKLNVNRNPLVISQSRGPRLGLSKRRSNKSTKIKNSIPVLNPNQTRLSMFGFQKKPSLK